MACAVDAAIRLAIKNNTLVVRSSLSLRFNEEFWLVEDDRGILGAFATEAEARARVAMAGPR